jgi:hypothetical protein
MKKRSLILATVVVLVVIFPIKTLNSWGFFGHIRINKMAVFTLPPEMIGFYKRYIDYVSEHAVDPDKRRYASKVEAPRHYIDIDHYGNDTLDAFDAVPERWSDAVAKYTEDTLQAYGIVPWHINSMMYWLTDAFKDKNVERILYLSADLGHYIADAHVPLHTTKNYNGQLTGQRGIHGFWESRIPELTADDYNYFVGRADYISSPLSYVWQTVRASHSAVDSVLDFERILNNKFPADQKYTYENRGASVMKQYSLDYTMAYNTMLDGMVERRMRKAVISVGSMWYTAWVNAGEPNLDKLLLSPRELAKLEKEAKELEEQFEGNTIKGREHDH